MDLPEDQKAKLKDLKATGADKFFKDAELPKRAADALRAQKKRQAAERWATIEQRPGKPVELWGFEPQTSCMP